MTHDEHDELAQFEDANRDLIAALGRLSRDVEASPDFLRRVMSRADSMPAPGRRWLAWLPMVPASPVPRLAAAMVVVLALIGAIPQYTTWLKRYVFGSSNTTYEAKIQEQLWRKNFNCASQLDRSSSNYAAITGDQVVVVAWACPSGDVLVTIESPDQKVAKNVWIALDEQRRSVGFLDWLIPTAFADHGVPHRRTSEALVAKVLCQKWLPNGHVMRRIRLADGSCYDEVIDPRNGRVVQRRSAPCNKDC
jgi:hypothetical protein